MILQKRPLPPPIFSMAFIGDAQKMVDEWLNDQKNRRQTPPPEIPRVWAKQGFTDPFKEQLFDAFLGKCVFCERKVDREERRILHFRPYDFKSDPPDVHYLWLYWQWPNIYAACSRCLIEYPNSAQTFLISGRRPDLKNDPIETLYGVKALFDLESPQLLDPCFDNPADHIRFVWKKDANIVVMEGKTQRGKATVKRLRASLNNPSLSRQRAVEAAQLWAEFEKAREEPGELVIRNMLRMCGADQPFAGMKRQFLQQWLQTAGREWTDVRKQLRVWRNEYVDPPNVFPKPQSPQITAIRSRTPYSNTPTIIDSKSVLNKLGIEEPIVRQILSKLYNNYEPIHVEQLFGSGASGAVVLQIRPIKDGKAHLREIVKLGDSNLIYKEWQAYSEHVKDRISDIETIKNPPATLEEYSLSGIRYSLAGDGQFEISSLREYLMFTETNSEKISSALGEKLLDKILSRLWETNKLIPSYWFQQYDNVLPVNLEIEEVTKVTDPGDPDLLDLTPKSGYDYRRYWKSGQLVRVNNFIITEIDHSKSKLTLNAPSPKFPPFRIRAQVNELRSLSKIGDNIQLFGSIQETRRQFLQKKATEALGKDYNPDSGYIRLPNGIVVRDPLHYVDKITELELDVKCSPIHGDLNLDNIIVRYNGENKWPENIHLIDFANTRNGHTLHDLMHLEMNVWVHVYSSSPNPDETLTTLPDFFKTLPPGRVNANDTMAISYLVLSMIRNAAKSYLAKPNAWDEYFFGLTLCLLGCLKYKSLNTLPTAPLPSKVAIYTAAMALAECKSFP